MPKDKRAWVIFCNTKTLFLILNFSRKAKDCIKTLSPEKLITKLARINAIFVLLQFAKILVPFVISISPAQNPVDSLSVSPKSLKTFIGKAKIL